MSEFNPLQISNTIGKLNDRKPPVHLWNPPLSGDIDIRIDSQGRWFHEGEEIRRRGLVETFASILKREGDDYFLVTPVEKWRIQVEDKPFLVVLLHAEGEGKNRKLVMTTSVGDAVVVDAEHPLRVETNPDNGEPNPSIRIRDNLEAKLSRNVFYELAELAEEGPDGRLGVFSCGQFFPLEAGES